MLIHFKLHVGLLSTSKGRHWGWPQAHGEQGLWFTDFTAMEAAHCLAQGRILNTSLWKDNEVCLTQSWCSFHRSRLLCLVVPQGGRWVGTAAQSKAMGLREAWLVVHVWSAPRGGEQRVCRAGDIKHTIPFPWHFWGEISRYQAFPIITLSHIWFTEYLGWIHHHAVWNSLCAKISGNIVRIPH